jgi:hypothetical protein
VARHAAVALTTDDDQAVDIFDRIRLLTDCRTAFGTADALPATTLIALTALWDRRKCGHKQTAQCECLVFVSTVGISLDAHNVRHAFRKVVDSAGIVGKEWTPRELRHSFVPPAVRRRNADRANLPVGRAHQHYGDRDRLPSPDPPCSY